MRPTVAKILCCLVLLPPGLLRAAEEPESFPSEIALLLQNHRGVATAAAKNLRTRESFEYDADRPMPTASLIKFPVMIAAYHEAEAGRIDLGLMVTLREEDKVSGSGVLTTHFSEGVQLPLRDAIRLMISFSDNTATNLVIDQIGLPTTTKLMRRLGCPNTRLHAKVYRGDTSIAPDRSRQFGLGSTTANEMLGLIEKLHQDDLASLASCDAMRDHLRACDARSEVPRLLPAGTTVAHKTGAVSAARTDAGVIESPGGPIAFCLLTSENLDQSWGEDNEASLLAAEFGLALYSHFNEGATHAAPVARVLRLGARGEMVQALQRTLNAKLSPSYRLGVDGDFGPITQHAVERFQHEAGLEVTGEVDAATWRALGPLHVEADENTSAEQTRETSPSKRPADRLDGPPVVTCKAYAIADGSTGRVLWGMNDSQPREPASVTKIMTAYLVLSLAQQDTAVLEDLVTFTNSADNTPGSTASVRAGERLKVDDALYGLLLPSGNDMAQALAVHFGARMAGSPSEEDHSACDRFVQAMNESARKLGMADTNFFNPHGLPAEGHVSSAGDLVTLTHAAMMLPQFRKVVSTRRYECLLDSVDGYRRRVTWHNTNKLLQREGFDGVKTGTTNAAGSCLVSTAERDGRRLIVAVLGSTSGESRYVDTRNLCRWAWGRLLREGQEQPRN